MVARNAASGTGGGGVESSSAEGPARVRARETAIGHVRELRGTHEDYLRELDARFADLRLDGLDVLLDCANGATYRVAPEIFSRLGRERDGHGGRAGRAQHQRRTAAPPT